MDAPISPRTVNGAHKMLQALKISSPTTVKPLHARPKRVLDARVQCESRSTTAGIAELVAVSDLKPKHAEKGVINGDVRSVWCALLVLILAQYASSFDTLAKASARYPCKGWIATQPSSWDARDASNVKLVEMSECVQAPIDSSHGELTPRR